MPSTKPTIAATPALANRGLEQLRQHFEVHILPPTQRVADMPGIRPETIRGIATSGSKTGCGMLGNSLFDQLPNLEIISSHSSGLDGIDTNSAAARGIIVTHSPHVLVEPVADIALALTLDITRGITAGDRYVRAGRWKKDGPMPLAMLTSGKLAGILGLGRIGKAIARRLAACGMTIAYHGRRRQTDCAYEYYDDLRAMAQACSLLVICCPATAETDGLVDTAVLEALGPQGYLVNIARGSVIDEAAMIAALRDRRIAAAGLDVSLNEPDPDPALLALDNLVILPHIGSATHETRQAMFDVMLGNLQCHFAGKPLISPFTG